jgi:hypothetical protein
MTDIEVPTLEMWVSHNSRTNLPTFIPPSLGQQITLRQTSDYAAGGWPIFLQTAARGKKTTRRLLDQGARACRDICGPAVPGRRLAGWVGFGSALFPFLESSLVDPQFEGEDGSINPGAFALLLRTRFFLAAPGAGICFTQGSKSKHTSV